MSAAPAGRVEVPPPGSALVTLAVDAFGEVVQGAAGQRSRGGVGQHGEAPDRGFESWSTAVLPGVSHPSITGPTAPVLNCKNSLERAHYVTQSL